jgi:ribosomal protein L11 methylase PrmA
VPEVDWVARVREGFRPFAAGSFLIVPAWEADESAAAEARVIAIEQDAQPLPVSRIHD